MKPAWQAWIERWLGVDATFLAAAAVHCIISWLLPTALLSDWLARLSPEEDVLMLCIGWMAASAGLLGIWTACGPGRLAVRCLWAVALSLGSWSVQARFVSETELVGVIMAAVCLFAGVMNLTVGFVLVLARGARLMRAFAGPNDALERWQFRLSDLLLFTLVAGIVVAARFWLKDFGPLFYEFGSDMGGQILYVIRCGGAMCATIVLAGTFLLLRDRPQFLPTLLACGLALAAAVLLTWLPLDEPSFGSVGSNFRQFGEAAAGSLVATFATLLPLRAWSWRCVTRNRTPPPKS
jgi:hypothetical protein